jgi:N-acetylated-alpha-linked acidic dipeptidase
MEIQRMRFCPPVLPLLLASAGLSLAQTPYKPARGEVVPGYRDFTQQAKWDVAFMAVPDAKLAGEHLKALTAAPHSASSKQPG